MVGARRTCNYIHTLKLLSTFVLLPPYSYFQSKKVVMPRKYWKIVKLYLTSSVFLTSLNILHPSDLPLSKNSRLIQQMHRSTFTERLEKNFLGIGNEPVLINSTGSNFGNFSAREFANLSL